MMIKLKTEIFERVLFTNAKVDLESARVDNLKFEI